MANSIGHFHLIYKRVVCFGIDSLFGYMYSGCNVGLGSALVILGGALVILGGVPVILGGTHSNPWRFSLAVP